MAGLKRALAVFLVITGVAAAGLLMITPLIHDGSPEYPMWEILNWFMMPGTLIILAVSFLFTRRHEDSESAAAWRDRLIFYGAIVLVSLFFWEWFWTLNPESETGGAITSHLIYFPAMDSLYTVLCLLEGRRLWRSAGGE